MRSDRVVVQCLLAVLACGACTTTDTERSAAVATRDSTAVAVDTARASAAADSALRDARLSRLRTLQPTVDDLAARDTLDIRDNLLGGTPRTGAD